MAEVKMSGVIPPLILYALTLYVKTHLSF